MGFQRDVWWATTQEQQGADAFLEELWDLPAVGRGEALWPDPRVRENVPQWPVLALPGEEDDAAQWWEQAPQSSTAVDASAAVTPFSAAERQRIEPLLGAAEMATAIRWNASKHAAKSGLSSADLRVALAQYVDFTALRAAIDRHDASNPAAALGLGLPPFDVDLVQAIYQFQQKCFFEPRWRHGKADAPTLDSLGFVKRAGLRTNRRGRVNRTARARLRKQPVERLSGGEFTADNWFHYILNPSFLGWTFVVGGMHSTGIHLYMVRKLRQAERWLLRKRNLEGSTPIALGRALLFSETDEIHRGWRPSSSTKSFHTFGLAMDVRYFTNPFITGGDFTRTFKNAVRLVSGQVIPRGSINRYLNSLGTDPTKTTGQLYDKLAEHDAAFVLYMALLDQPETLRELLQARKADGTAGVFRRGESIERAMTRWRDKVRVDRAAMKSRSSPFRTNGGGLRNIDVGFLSLDRDLVIALRDHACLAWGALDLGSGGQGSGDVMHFDARVCGLGGRLPSGGQRKVRSGHPCVPCLPPLLERERGRPAPRAESRTLRRLSRSGSRLGPTPLAQTLYVDIPLGSEGSAKPMTGIFIPQRYRLPDDDTVDVILYLHGHKRDMQGFANNMSIKSYWNSDRFNGLWALREQLNIANRNAILVAPTLGYKSGAGALTRKSGGLDWYLGQVLRALAEYGELRRPPPTQLTLGNLIVAAHSGGGAPMRTLARSKARMTAKITECWGFDSMYSSDGPKEWAQWARANPNTKLYMHYADIDRAPRRYGRRLRDMNVPNVSVQAASSNDHFEVVLAHWRQRIMAAPSLSPIRRPQIF